MSGSAVGRQPDHEAPRARGAERTFVERDLRDATGKELSWRPGQVAACPGRIVYLAVIVASMLAWYLQWYLMVPALEKVKLKLLPGSRLPESNEPSSAVTV